jgi:hypothetical protein
MGGMPYFTERSEIVSEYSEEKKITILAKPCSDVVVGMLATEPKGCGFEPGQGDGFLREIKIRSTPSIGWEVKAEVSCL